jgi:hypothetical protein
VGHGPRVRALPTADRFLADFFADRRRGASRPMQDRIDRMEADVRLAVELAEVDVLDADGLLLVDAERQFDLPLTLLPIVLQRYLTDPLYRPRTADEAHERLDACAALVRRLAREPDLAGATRQLRRLDERIRMETATLRAERPRLRIRRVRG